MSGGYPEARRRQARRRRDGEQGHRQGGDTIGYADEDPMIREIFKQKLAAAGATIRHAR